MQCDSLKGLFDGNTARVGNNTLEAKLAPVVTGLNDNARQVLKDLISAQVDSIEQRRRIGLDRLIDITRSKGASTILLLATVVKSDLSPEKKGCYQEFGYLIQLLDDLADKTQDQISGICTLANLDGHARDLLELILKQYLKVRDSFMRTYSLEQLPHFLRHLDERMANAGILMPLGAEKAMR